MSSSVWQSGLRRVQTASVASAFDSFLDRHVNIGKGIRSTASGSHNHLRDFLASEISRDTTFPRVLSTVDCDFLGGSFARHTKIWPLDDIDIYVPIDGLGLIYHNQGVKLPYTVLSDNTLSWNPVCSLRWMNGQQVSSVKLVQGFTAVLKRHYGEDTHVAPNGQAVSVRLTHGETKEADGLGYDVVPCFSMTPHESSEFSFYVIPDGNDGWLRTNPRLDTIICNQLQEFNSKHYRKVVKLMKYWNREQLGGAFSSYYVELALSRRFLARKSEAQPLGSISQGVVIGFDTLKVAYASGDQTPFITDAPVVERPYLTPLQQSTLSLAAATANLAYAFESSGSTAEAVGQWKDVFGNSF